jgi:hypothetical protein
MKKRYLAVSALLGWLLLIIVLMIISGYVNAEIYFVLGLIGLMVIAILITPIYSRPRYARRLLVVRMLGAALFIALFLEQFLTGLPAISIPMIGAYIPIERVITVATSLVGVVCVFTGAVVLNSARGISAKTLQEALNAGGSPDCRGLPRDSMTYYIPPEREGDNILQFVPAPATASPQESKDVAYIGGRPVRGQYRVPSGMQLFEMLKRSYSLRLPVREEDVLTAIQEVCEDVIEVADRVVPVRREGYILIELQNYRLLSICTELKQDFPVCCRVHPCPICSLIACMLAEGLGITCSLEHVHVEPDARSITLYFVFIP